MLAELVTQQLTHFPHALAGEGLGKRAGSQEQTHQEREAPSGGGPQWAAAVAQTQEAEAAAARPGEPAGAWAAGGAAASFPSQRYVPGQQRVQQRYWAHQHRVAREVGLALVSAAAAGGSGPAQARPTHAQQAPAAGEAMGHVLPDRPQPGKPAQPPRPSWPALHLLGQRVRWQR